MSRRKAAEVLVWLLSDVNRTWHVEIPHSIPVCYVMKGYSLPMETMIKLCDKVLDACVQQNIHVACTTFDGAFQQLTTMGTNREQLTLIQLTVSLWKKVCALSREEVVCALATVVLEVCFDFESRSISCPFMAWLQRYIRHVLAAEKPHNQSEPQEQEEVTHIVRVTRSLADLVDNDNEAGDSMENDNDNIDIRAGYEPGNAILNTSGPDPNKAAGNSDNQGDRCPRALTDDQATAILLEFQSHSNRNIANAWAEKSLNDVKSSVETARSLQRLRVPELNILIHHTRPEQNVCGVFVKLGAAKIDKVNALSDVIGDGSNIALNMFVDKVHSLTTLAGNILMKKAMGVRSPSKDMLNVVCATSIYPHERREWESKSTMKDIKIVTDDFECKPEYWFSYPEYSDNHQQLDPKCLDAHHLFVNCRVKVCKDGLEGFGIKNDAWLSVAEKFPHVISKCLVQDLLDKQNNAFAQRTFGKSVEEVMRELGYIEEANFSELIRNWYQAED